MAHVITTQKILETAVTERIAYKGKHRMWYVSEANDGYRIGASKAPAQDNHEATVSVFGSTHPDLGTALDHVAWAENRDNGK